MLGFQSISEFSISEIFEIILPFTIAKMRTQVELVDTIEPTYDQNYTMRTEVGLLNHIIVKQRPVN